MSDDQSQVKPEPAFSYAEHFGTMRTLGELLRDPAHRPWLTSVPKDAPHRKYVIWLGCNILRTVQLAETLDDILQYLQEDYVTLGGPSNCCGIVHESMGDVAVGKNMLQQTMKKFDAFTPEQMLCWCPSCDNQLRAESQDVVTETAKQRISFTRFLASQIDRLRFSTEVPLKIALHFHGGFAEQETDGAEARLLLSRIPGLTLIDMVGTERLGRHCSDAAIKGFGESQYPGAMEAWIAGARRRGATHVATLYHSCHRQLLLTQRTMAAENQLPVVNYLTLLARSLGLRERDDRFAQLASRDSIETMLAEVDPNVRTLGVKPDQAQRALKAQFQR
jgi:Fe-S oxidoreductase